MQSILSLLKRVILCLAFLVLCHYYASLNSNESEGIKAFPASVNIEFNGARKRAGEATTKNQYTNTTDIQCDWCDASQASSCGFSTLEFKPPSQIRLPSISSVYRDDAVKKITFLLVSVDTCSPNKQQHVRVVPAIPSHYGTFAMMKLPSDTMAMHLNSSLLYTNILSAQRAGYAGVLIFLFDDFSVPQCAPALHQKSEEISEQIFIPVLIGTSCNRTYQHGALTVVISDDELNHWISNLDFTPAKFSVKPKSNEKLEDFKSYLRRLYWWFLVGPLLTLVWLLKTKQLPSLWQSRRPAEPESPVDREHENESTPLLPFLRVHTSEAMNREESPEERNHATSDCLPSVKRLTRYTNHFFWLLGCLIFPLPIGISAGGLAFLRLDENDATDFVNLSFTGWIDFLHCEHTVPTYYRYYLCSFFSQAVNGMFLLWSPVQVFFFLMYSKVKCRQAWIIQNNYAKIIRCSWFKSGNLLLMLGFIVPLGVSIYNSTGFISLSNTVCTISNCIFLLVLNKHSQCTVFVFYTSVCMVCAYIESNVVIIMYFMLNSVESLDDLRTTAIRTAEIYAALRFSFQTSMHIIRKLQKPNDSLFSSLSEH